MKTKKPYTKNMALSSICLAISVIMPYVFHFAGPQSGTMFLPLFLGIAISAFIVPIKYTILIAILAPVINHLVSGMPPVLIIYFMIVEIVSYGVILSILNKK